jgi:hypothetical protein
MKEEHIIPLLQRVKHRYVVESIDRVVDGDEIGLGLYNLNDVECLVLFTKADPDDSDEDCDDDTGEWWKSPDSPASKSDTWIEDYGDDLYYK